MAAWISFIAPRCPSKTPNRDFIQVLGIEVGGVARTSLLMHPPSSSRYKLSLRGSPRLDIRYAMFPATYGQAGDGVRFPHSSR